MRLTLPETSQKLNSSVGFLEGVQIYLRERMGHAEKSSATEARNAIQRKIARQFQNSPHYTLLILIFLDITYIARPVYL